MILDWLIVGGGIHGVHIAARLISQAKVGIEQIRIVDPYENCFIDGKNVHPLLE